MAYYVPLRFINVSSDMVLCATRIVAIGSLRSTHFKKILQKEKQNGNWINGCPLRQKARSVIFLDNGTLVTSPRSAEFLARSAMDYRAMNPDMQDLKKGAQFRIYDVVSPDEENCAEEFDDSSIGVWAEDDEANDEPEQIEEDEDAEIDFPVTPFDDLEEE